MTVDIPVMLKLLNNLWQLRLHERWTRARGSASGRVTSTPARVCLRASPSYQQFHKGLFDRPLNELPVLTKAMKMELFDELVTDRSLRLEQLRAYAAQRSQPTLP